ncbi:protein SOB FIVE-LIKE 3-like [Lycium barbarum]|uniref:protein SOB FIVE-LIKE 3-like n=1 Tax=Lycium barbarum TaxID=112863 RepID=UPI00293EE6FE|nr:protein SOB FIVE-LIKE 3-like [Lycium barbarum]
MEPKSQIYNDGEECHSSESGWTMYIGSPEDDEMNYEGDFDGYDDDIVGDRKNINEDDDDTDDSMASDASSGPSHIIRNANKSPIPKEKGNGKGGSKNNKASMKNGGIKNQEKGEYSVFSAKGAKVPSNGEKVKKSIWKGKGK